MVLHDANPLAGQRVRDRLMPDPELHPHDLRSCGEDLVKMLRDVRRPSKEQHHIRWRRHGRERTMNRLPEDLGHIREVHGDRDHHHPVLLQCFWNVIRRSTGLGRFDPDHGHAAHVREDRGDPCSVFDEKRPPVARVVN